MKNILITGGLGNLGSWLTEYLVRSSYQIDVLSVRKKTFLDQLKFNFIQCDISDYSECKNLLGQKKYDIVIHTASTNDAFQDNYFSDAIDVNVKGTRNLLETFKTNPPKHFIYFSTFQVYGKYDGVISESTETNPINDYGSTHLFAEYYIKQFNCSHNFPYTILRLTNGYGCPLDINSSKWYLILNDLSKNAYYNQQIKLNSDGESQRDFIWLGDVCSVVHSLIKNGATNDTFNLSSEKSFKLKEVAKYVQEAYYDEFKYNIPITFGKPSTNSNSNELLVKSTKLRSIVPFETNLEFVSEAKKIFTLLSSQKPVKE